jgi:hypothetical protein
MKTCRTCKEEKAYENFSLARRNTDGLNAICKACDNLRRKKSGAQTYKKYEKRRKKDPMLKVKAWCKGQVRNAKDSGILTIQPCEVCGSTIRVEAHHDNYFLPLQVNWLCATHHRRRHYELNVIAKTQGRESHPFFQVPEQVGKNTLQGKLL